MSCPRCLSNDVIHQLRVDMDTLRWIEIYDCGECTHHWEEWSAPMQPEFL